MKKPIRILIISIITISVLVLACFAIKYYVLDNEEKLFKTIDTIDDYGYNLDDRDTEYYKSLFNELKTLLDKDHNDIEYANLVAKLYITDLYTLSNKINKYDVGGVEFIFKDFKDDYVSSVKTTLYRYLQDNEDGNRKQDLPIVEDVKVACESNTYEHNEKEYDGYICNTDITYKEDFGYDTTVKLVLIKDGNIISIAESNN